MADYQAVVVGAGAGGPVAAYVLASRGWKVALVEKGRNPYPTLGASLLRGSLYSNDEIKLRRRFSYQDPLIEPRTFKIGDTAEYTSGDIQALGIAVGGGKGLVVPVLRAAERASLAEIERQIADFGARAQNGKLTNALIRANTMILP